MGIVNAGNFVSGWIRDSLDHRDFKFGERGRIVRDGELPPTYDLRRDPKYFDVWDQENEGSCVGHGSSAAFLMQARLEGVVGDDWRPSRQFCYTQARIEDGGEGAESVDSGASIRGGVKGIADFGICSELIWPYFPENLTEKPSDAAYFDAKPRLATQYHSVDLTNRNEVKAAIYQKLFVDYGMSVFNQIFNAPGGVVSFPGSNESPAGGHCVVLIGWTDLGYVFRNSWGKNWGDFGHGIVPFGYVENPQLASDAWVLPVISGLIVPTPTPALSPSPSPAPAPVGPPSPAPAPIFPGPFGSKWGEIGTMDTPEGRSGTWRRI